MWWWSLALGGQIQSGPVSPGAGWHGPYRTAAEATAALQAAQSPRRRRRKQPSPPPPGGPPGKAKASIAADARQYAGQGYVYGGRADVPGDWDCSSFVSYVLGHDLKLRLPGGKYGDPGFPPNAHGPVVLDYASWAGAAPVPAPEAGDLCLWPGSGASGHMGIALSGSRMISALNPQLGTLITDIAGAGPSGVQVVFRRVAGAPGGLGILQPVAGAGVGAGLAGGAVTGLVLVSALAGLVLLIAAGVGLLGGAAVTAGVAAVAGSKTQAEPT